MVTHAAVFRAELALAMRLPVCEEDNGGAVKLSVGGAYIHPTLAKSLATQLIAAPTITPSLA